MVDKFFNYYPKITIVLNLTLSALTVYLIIYIYNICFIDLPILIDKLQLNFNLNKQLNELQLILIDEENFLKEINKGSYQASKFNIFKVLIKTTFIVLAGFLVFHPIN